MQWLDFGITNILTYVTQTHIQKLEQTHVCIVHTTFYVCTAYIFKRKVTSKVYSVRPFVIMLQCIAIIITIITIIIIIFLFLRVKIYSVTQYKWCSLSPLIQREGERMREMKRDQTHGWWWKWEFWATTGIPQIVS